MSDLTIIEKLDDIIDSKNDIKQVLDNNGQHPTEVLSTYAGLIENIASAELDIQGTEFIADVSTDIPKGKRFVGEKENIGNISVSVLATFEDEEYEIYPNATVISSDGKVAFSLLSGNKGRVCILRDDGTKYRHIFDVEYDTEITRTSAKSGTHMGITYDGTRAMFTITHLIGSKTYINYYVLKIDRTFNNESVTLYSGVSSGLNDDDHFLNTNVRLGIITNNMLVNFEDDSQGGYDAITYSLATKDMWRGGVYGTYNVIELGTRFGAGSYPLRPYSLTYRLSVYLAVSHGTNEHNLYTPDSKQVVISKYIYSNFSVNDIGDIVLWSDVAYDYNSTLSTDEKCLIVTTVDGCNIYTIDNLNWSVTGGPYHFPFAIRQFDGIYAITDDKYYLISSVENCEYKLLGSHNIYNVGKNETLCCTYRPTSLNSTWSGTTIVNGKEVPCVLKGVKDDAQISDRYSISIDNTGTIEDNKIYGVASKNLVAGSTETLKYSFKDSHLSTTATVDDILLGKTAYSNGQYIVGMNPGGIDTSDANALEIDIAKDKTAYVNDQKITGTLDTYDSNSEDYEVAMSAIGKGLDKIAAIYTFDSDVLFRSGSTIVETIQERKVAGLIGLTSDILKKDETVLGVVGTYEGDEYAYEEAVRIADDILGES